MAGLLSFAMMAGCGNSTEPVAGAEEEEEDDRNLADEIEDEAEPELEPVQAAEPEEEPEPEEERNSICPDPMHMRCFLRVRWM